MADFRITFFSNCLQRPVPFDMFIPNDYRTDPFGQAPEDSDQKIKTLFLLHGYTGNAGNWIPEELARKYHFAVVMPNGENAFYLDGEATGHQYLTYLGEELVGYVRRTFSLAMCPEDTYIMGMSMGGFGAIHTALAYPDVFGKAVGMSSALIVHGIAHMKEGTDNGVANYAYYRECFGDLETVEERDTNPEVLVKKLLAAQKKIPDLYLCCGTEDFLLEPNRALHKFLEDNGVAHEYHESKGNHDMIFWSEYVTKAVPWLFESI